MSELNRFHNANEDDDDDDDDDDDNTIENDGENQWYYPRTSSPHSSLSVNNSFTHQSSSATMGSWGFDVNRSTNGQTPLSFTSNNNNSSDQQIITRATKDYNERRIDIPSSPPPPPPPPPSQNFKLRTPTLTKRRDGNEFAAVDRLLLGPNRTSNDLSQPQMTPSSPPKIQAEQELIAWQNRMLQRDQRIDNPPSSQLNSKRNGINSIHSSSRQTSTANRRIPAMLSTNENQYSEHDHHEPTIKSARVIKRYIELVYHLQSFYERITDQLFNGKNFLKTNQSSPSLFTNHCQKIADQLQKLKPVWVEKLADLHNELKDVSSSQWPTITNQTSFLQRRLTLINLVQMFSREKDLDETDLSIRTDIDRVLYEDKLAGQLQDELSTLLQHQSLLNDFTSLLQWNRPIYSPHEQNRVENVLPFLREQITTTDSYMSHVSQQLTELVTSLRSSEKYILSYTNTIPFIDDGTVPSQRTSTNHAHGRSSDKTDIDLMKTKESRSQQSHQSRLFLSSPDEKTNESPPKKRSISMSRHVDSEELNHHLDRDDLRISPKNFNTNNSNNNGMVTRFAAVKPAKRDDKIQSNVKSILKSYSHTRSSNGRKTNFDNHDQMLKSNERLERLEKKEGVRKLLSKQNIQERNDQDFTDEDYRLPLHRRGFGKERGKAPNVQSIRG